MCLGTFLVSYSCGHVISTPNVCLQDVDPHYRCEPRGMKITQPNGRCVECYARDISLAQHLTTTIRFNPDPLSAEKPQDLTPQSSFEGAGKHEAVIRWVMDIQDPGHGLLRNEWDVHRNAESVRSAMGNSSSSLGARYRGLGSHGRRTIDPRGYEADDDLSF